MPNTYSQDLISEDEKTLNDFVKIHSITYNVDFYFLSYGLKLTENLTIRWNEQTVFGRMDPIPTYKGMGRAMTLSFQARQKLLDSSGRPYKKNYDGKELLHDIDHLKKCLYPRYDGTIMVTPPLFRVSYKNLITAGVNTMKDIKDPTNGVLCYITTFSANPATEPNKIYFPSDKKEFAFPKVFDVNMTFTVLNEDLVSTQGKGALKERYFFNYETDYHGHEEETAPEPEVTVEATAGSESVEETQAATEAEVLG